MTEKLPARWVMWFARIVGGVVYVAAGIWVLWATARIYLGEPLPLTSLGFDSPHPFGALLFLLFVGPLVMAVVRWAFTLAILPLALAFRRPATTREQLERGHVEFRRHVSLMQDGKGVTFYLHRLRDGEVKWSWSYDAGVRDDLHTSIATEGALCVVEKELGLPMTFPHSDPDRPPPVPKQPTAQEVAVNEQQRRERAASGDPLAIRQLWDDAGDPVTSPESLLVGEYYSVGYDIAIYAGQFEGRRFDGYPDLADEPDNTKGIWYAFESAERSIDSPSNGTRYNRKDLAGDGVDPPPVKTIPATRDAIEKVFNELRESHREWERNRLPDRYF